MDKILSRRIEKIEKKLQPEKGHWLRLPDIDNTAGYIEIKGSRTLADFLLDIDRLETNRR